MHRVNENATSAATGGVRRRGEGRRAGNETRARPQEDAELKLNRLASTTMIPHVVVHTRDPFPSDPRNGFAGKFAGRSTATNGRIRPLVFTVAVANLTQFQDFLAAAGSPRNTLQSRGRIVILGTPGIKRRRTRNGLAGRFRSLRFGIRRPMNPTHRTSGRAEGRAAQGVRLYAIAIAMTRLACQLYGVAPS